MRTLEQLLDVQLQRARSNQEAIRKTLADGFITPSEARDLRKRLKLAQITEADTAAELSKFAYLK